MALMRKLFPATGYISLSDVAIGEDDTHDYAQFYTGWGTDYGPEPIYYRTVIFAKKKTEDWSKARVFDSGSLGQGPFVGPIDALESNGRELGEPEPATAPEPTPGAATAPAAQEPREP